ncbi:MAG: iron-containing alcohol dehydrogenase [Bacteriovoracia bacterium]
MSQYRFSFPTPIHFGAGVRRQVADFLKAQKIERPLIVTDRGVAAIPVFQDFAASLAKGGLACETFSGIWGNPVKSQVTAGVQAYRAHRADAIVGIGGGAALDVAKAIALMVTHPGDLFDYEDEKPGARPVDGEIPFWIALPTTSGTGSEVGRSSVVSDDETHVKKIIFSTKLLARAVFADPEFTLELPAKITAAVGMDALTHCVEAYLAKGFHPICDGIALEGVRLCGQSLVRVVTTPSDIQARSLMMMGSMMGAIAFQKGLGLTHSCAHALSTVVDMHHGLANGIMIDHALKFNVPAVPERFTNLAQTVGLKDIQPSSFVKWLTELKAQTGIPAQLGEMGVKKDQVERLSQIAIADACHPSNPRACTQDDFRRIFTEAL